MRLRIHGKTPNLDTALRSFTYQQSHLTLGRVSPRVAAVDIYLEDVNGPRGGQDKGCRLVAKLLPGGEIVVQGSAGDWETLVHASLRRLARAVIRELDRRRSNHARRLPS